MADQASDPEFEPAECKCGGGGWVNVQPSYAEQLYPDPAPEVLAQLQPDQADALYAEVAARRAAALNTVYPCRVHKAELFYRWAGHHFGKDHDAGACGECIEARTGSSGRRRSHGTARRDTA